VPVPTTAGRVLRQIFDCAGAEDLATATSVRREGQVPVGDAAVDEAYDGLGATWRLYAEVYGRDSIDDAGLPLHGYVHYGRDYDNAFWDGEQMVFGDGDTRLFNRFTIAVDVIGHELTHGVTQVEAALTYQDQAGALNESVSDVFGSLVKQYARRQSAQEADWLIGDELLRVDGALRSMAAPGTAYDDPVLGRDPQPATMAGYVETSEDNGGVHINSGIPNHAFYLAATALGGYAWQGAGQVWYRALRDPQLAPDAGFAQFAAATLRAAQQLGDRGVDPASGPPPGEVARDGDLAQAVEEAWQRVGVRPAA
jgi:Zn-dependent metalloprotease